MTSLSRLMVTLCGLPARFACSSMGFRVATPNRATPDRFRLRTTRFEHRGPKSSLESLLFVGTVTERLFLRSTTAAESEMVGIGQQLVRILIVD